MKLGSKSQYALSGGYANNHPIKCGGVPRFTPTYCPQIHRECVEDGLIQEDVPGEYHWTALAELLYKLGQL